MARRTICAPIFSSPLRVFDELVDILCRADESNAAAGDDAFLDRRAGGVHGVLNASLLLLHLGLGCGADLDDGDAADQLGEALLELLAVVVGGGLVDLVADLLDAAFDGLGVALAFDDGGVVLVDGDALGAAEVLELHVLELDAEVFGDGLAAGEDGDVLKHGLAAIAEAGGLDGRDLERATELVDDEGGEGVAVDVFRDDDEGLAGLHGLLEQGQQVLHGGDLLLVDEDVGVLERGFHAVGIGDEVGREVAAIELHALDDFELGLEGLRLFDGDDAVLADLLHGLGDDGADGGVGVGGDGADLGDHVAGDGLGELRERAACDSRSHRACRRWLRQPCRCRA